MNEEPPEHFRAYQHVWVFVEVERGQVHPVSWELMGAGRRLADKLGVLLAGVVIGAPDGGTSEAVAEAFCYGADRVYLCEDPILAHYRNEPYTTALKNIVNSFKPEILLLGATNLGRDLAGSVATTLLTGLTADLAGSVATTLLTGLTADSTELDVNADGSLVVTRPTFGGSLLCTIYTLNSRLQMATVRPRVMPMPARVERPLGPVTPCRLLMDEKDIVTKVLSFVADREASMANLAYADIVVAGGLGLQSAGNVQLVRNLALSLGAEFGGSRPLVQKGWIDSDRQIGQTGKTIRPKLYIAAGISGAIQHRVGVEGADLIVAINTDPNAPIFDFAHLGVVADAIQLLPALTETFRRRLSPHS